MKRIINTLLVLIYFNLLAFNSFSQCEPLTPEQCPDPENNGQICPDSLEAAFVGQFYSQVATIKPPAFYYLPPDSTLITLHHVKLTEVGNLPDGLNWQSNTPDSVFTAGEYYCVLMEGTPDSAGQYPLKITVDVYVLVFGVPVKAATVTDSTSLSIAVIDNSGINDLVKSPLSILQNAPNPFRDETRIIYYSDRPGILDFEVYSSQGQMVHSQKAEATRGENYLVYHGKSLAAGLYHYILKADGFKVSGTIIRTAD
jgi:hypothetical protein